MKKTRDLNYLVEMVYMDISKNQTFTRQELKEKYDLDYRQIKVILMKIRNKYDLEIQEIKFLKIVRLT